MMRFMRYVKKETGYYPDGKIEIMELALKDRKSIGFCVKEWEVKQ